MFQIEKETLTITDEEMIQGMKIVAERMKLVSLSPQFEPLPMSSTYCRNLC